MTFYVVNYIFLIWSTRLFVWSITHFLDGHLDFLCGQLEFLYSQLFYGQLYSTNDALPALKLTQTKMAANNEDIQHISSTCAIATQALETGVRLFPDCQIVSGLDFLRLLNKLPAFST